MSAKRNCYFYSRIAVWLHAGSSPCVTIACSTFRVHELFYRTSPSTDKLISRRVSRVADLQTIPIDAVLLKRIRCGMEALSATVRRDAPEYLKQDRATSSWFFQPKRDGWFAVFNGGPGEVRAFQHWLSEILT